MKLVIRGLIVCAGIAWASLAAAAPGGAAAGAPALHKAAEAEHKSGNSQKALELIEQGLATAPKDLKLLGLKGVVLLELRDYAGALAAYEAYLAAGATGANQREAKKIVDKLVAVKTTFLEVGVAGGPADVYLDSATLGVFCRAEPSCRKAVLPGEYTVIVERPGFERWSDRVRIEKDATAKLAVKLAELPSTLTVRAPEGATVTVDGAAHDPAKPLPAGSHRVVVSLAGHADAQREVVAREGQPIELDVTLEPLARAAPVPVAPPPPPPPSGWLTGRRKLALAAGGVGVAALGAGIVLGLSANGLDEDTYELCPADPCEDAEEANDLNRKARSRALQANIAFGVAGGAAIAAAVLWLTGAPEARVAVTPQVGAVTGLDLTVRF